MQITPIAYFRSPLTSKFGVPKQSGIVQDLPGRIVFEPPYNNADYIRGIDGYDFLWLIWEFSANGHKANSPVVRPPVLGGNEKMGVFATRSPFRPNPLGLSSVKIVSIDYDSMTITVSGADLMDGTPIYDIKPYLPFTDSHPSARGGFSAQQGVIRKLDVIIEPALESLLEPSELAVLREILAQDPRPRYIQDSEERIYGMPFAKYDVRFRVVNNTLEVVELRIDNSLRDHINN